MLKIYDKSSSVTFPNLKTYTAEQLAESDDYRSMMEYTTVISVDSDGITSAFYRLANLAEMYEVEEQEDPEETLRLVVAEIEKRRQEEEAEKQNELTAIEYVDTILGISEETDNAQ